MNDLNTITDKVRYTRNTDFVYNGQKPLVPTGTLYARFTVYLGLTAVFTNGTFK